LSSSAQGRAPSAKFRTTRLNSGLLRRIDFNERVSQMVAAVAIFICCLIWLVPWTRRHFRLRKRNEMHPNIETELRQKAADICEFAVIADKSFVLRGRVMMVVYPDFKARLIERGKSADGKRDFEEITSMAAWYIARRWYAISLSPRRIGFHAVDNDTAKSDFDLMPHTPRKDDADMIVAALYDSHSYLGLPEALVDARKPKPAPPPFEMTPPSPPHQTREYDITPSNKMTHIAEYLEDGDPRIFDDMFYGDFEQKFVLWVDHREDDEDIPKMCERILRTGDLDAWWADNDTPDLIIFFRGVEHRVVYPNDYADRYTSIIALSKILHPEYELRYCTASDGSDTAAFLPLTSEEWHALEGRFADGLERLFKPVDDNFTQFGE
jgi:hypothetical protein